ncbi:hypothetical protein [Actinomycetospora straminea]|uniref:hypothetical protein n=1 Tax=Actinomycetospora straminea TaxID=663607 RepID=UPI0023664280|nr:hypothetical protein [Actinomycetospora straminea]MDD7933754.1 hypothetical protein [Actinomycetospora straminea]
MIAATLDVKDEPGRTWRHDLCLPLRDTRVEMQSGSGFEGVATDGNGAVVLLREEAAQLLTMTPNLSQLLQICPLTVPDDHPQLSPGWHQDPNSRGEGLILLKDGHVLMARQKDDPCLIEFGPAEHTPNGIAAATILGSGESFQLPQPGPQELVPLAVWLLADNTKEALPTINDIAVGPDGRVYVLSSKSKVIARLEKDLKPGKHFRAAITWRIDEEDLPGGENAQPEGLAMLPSGRAIVALDTKNAGCNLVVLKRLKYD